ncbi:MAG: hypothetical protein FWC51_00550, partial [Proteobacteria bacterium]|nr:hypothetical protein [Pseudomonadota bacterium]
MNNELRDFLGTDLQFIKGVGPVLAARLGELLGGRLDTRSLGEGRRVLDFLLHAPNYVKPRGMTDTILNAKPGTVITIPVQIVSHKRGGVFRSGRRAPTQ